MGALAIDAANPPPGRAWLWQAIVALAYLGSGVFIHRVFGNGTQASVIWPGSGIALAALLVGGERMIVGVFIGALTLNAFAHHSPWVVAGLTLANVLEAWLGARLLRWRGRPPPTLRTLTEFVQLLMVGGGLASVAGAAIGGAMLFAPGQPDPEQARTALHWWLGDTLGVTLFAPLILVWSRTRLADLRNDDLVQGLLLIVAALVAGQIVFLGWLHEYLGDAPKGYWIFLFVALTAIRVGIRGTTVVVVIAALQGLLGAYHHVGFFANDIAGSHLFNYGMYMLVLAVVGAALATYVDEVKGALRALRDRGRVQREQKQFLKSILDSALDAVILVNARGVITGWSGQAEQMFGWRRDEALGRSVDDTIVPPRFRERHARGFQHAVLSGGGAAAVNRRWEVTALHRGGLEFPVELSISALPMAVGLGFSCFVRDISERRHAQEELRIAGIAFESLEGMIVTDSVGHIIRVNRAFTQLTGFQPEDVLGKTPAVLKSGRNNDLFYKRMWQTLIDSGYWQGEMWNRRKDGRIYAEWLTISAVKDAAGVTTHYVGTFSEITKNKEAEAEIHRLAYYDPLTHLPNRRLLLDRIGQAISGSSRSRHFGALLFMDLDHFKNLNDSRGHDVGDQLLSETARRIQANVREGDTVARLGGDEFVVMLEDLSSSAQEAAIQADHVSEKIRAALAVPYDLAGREFHCSASIGIALFRDQDETVETLLRHADLAMYKAKQAGRNTVRFFDPAMQTALEERSQLEADLRGALERGEFRLHFQPQVDQGARTVGAEVLLRWVHPQRGFVPPGEFVPLAEETGLIVPIGSWVLESACAQLVAWSSAEATRSLTLAVNVSARQLARPDFVDHVVRVLTATGANPRRLKIELTESMVLDDVDDALSKMRELKALGVGFSLDDFGTGNSSLAYLTRLPLDQLKIDRSFVLNLPDSHNDAVIAHTIITMAASLGLHVIAEGVETEGQRAFLELHGCNAFQGYLFSRPLPLSDFEAYVAVER